MAAADLFRAQTFTVARDGLLSEIGFQVYNTSPVVLTPAIFVYHASTGSASTAVPQSAHPLFGTSVQLSSFPTNTASVGGAVPLTSFPLVGAQAIPVKAGDVLTLGLALESTSANNLHWRAGADAYAGGRFFSKVGTGSWGTTGGTVSGSPQVYDAGFRTAITDMTVQRFAPAVDATATRQVGGGYAVNTTDPAINVQSTAAANTDRRGILEFNASAIADGADIRAATLTFNLNAITTDGVTFPAVAIYAYAGDGAATGADAAQTATFIGASQAATVIGEKIDVSLNASILETLLASSDHLGLLVVGSSNGRQFGFDANESTGFGGLAPSLTIAYVPEPAAAGALGLAASAGLLTCRRPRRR